MCHLVFRAGELVGGNMLYMNDITDENGRVSQDYLIEKLKNKMLVNLDD